MKRARVFDKNGVLRYDVHVEPDVEMEDGYYSPLPPYEPIDWTEENQWMFLNGVMKVETITREEFNRRYGAV